MKAQITWITIVAAALAGPLLAPAQMASASTPAIARTVDSSAWAGFSAIPVKGFIVDEEANWNVPKVTCPLSHPRADVWVGMWGSLKSMALEVGTGKRKHKHTPDAWVPQIGTDSSCNVGQASYRLTWEMFSQVKGGGNIQRYGLDCPGDATYSLCGNLTSVSYNDAVNAAVYFEGPYTTKPAKRTFEIRLTDLTTGDYASGTITTNKPVRIRNIAAQGGAIVENYPPCGLIDVLLTHCAIGPNGLAKFAGPVTIGSVSTLVYRANPPLRYYRWEMNLNGHMLAQDSQLAVVDKTMNYNVNWLRQN